MSLAPRLDLRQSQSLVMTPQLQQAIKLLTLSNLELEAVIAEEIEKNPLLEVGGGDAADDLVAASDAPADDEPRAADRLIESGDATADAPLDVDYASETFQHDSAADSGLGMNAIAAGGGEDGADFEGVADHPTSLHDHLLAQAGLQLWGSDFVIAERLIDRIDEAGYLTATVLEIALELGVPLARVEAVLCVLHSFDPTGAGARSLSECLALQAKERDRFDPCMEALLSNLDMLAAGRLSQLRRICGVDEEDLADMIRELRAYDPKPGLRFGGERSQPVAPDVFVSRRGSGWSVEINGATLPRLLINRRYHAELVAGAHDKATRAWLSEQLAGASWLVKALDQRQRTIVKVASELVKQQEAFFLKGVAYLRPLTLKQLADEIEVHESTVSRVTSNKYLSCARGLFELKYFFTSAIQATEGGEAVSAEAVRSHIRALIATESPGAILSDDALVEMLRARGFDIARRTVAKYREGMGLGSSVQRRRQKALEAAY